MKLRSLLVPLLSFLVVGLLVINAVQYVAYRRATASNDRVADRYARTAVGNLLDINDQLRAIKTPVTPAANGQILVIIDKLYYAQQGFDVVFFMNPTQTQADRALLDGMSTSRGALGTMIQQGDYQQFDRVRNRIAALASPFSAPFGPDFLNDFRRELVNVPL